MKGVKLTLRQYNYWANSVWNIRDVVHPKNYSVRACGRTIAITVQKYLTYSRTHHVLTRPMLKPGKPQYMHFFYKNLWRPNKINIRYRGKSFRVIQQRIKRRLVLRFSRCHKTYFYYPYSKLIYKKNKYFKLITNLRLEQRERLSRLVWRVRRYNIYNKRGLHPRQFVVHHKKGKVSAYR